MRVIGMLNLRTIIVIVTMKKITTTIFLFALIVQYVIAQVIQEQATTILIESKTIKFLEMSPQTQCQHAAYEETLARVLNEVSMKSDDKQQLRELATRPGDYTFVYNNRSYRPEFGIRKQ